MPQRAAGRHERDNAAGAKIKRSPGKEDYETAAACRDQIRALKAGKGGEVHE